MSRGFSIFVIFQYLLLQTSQSSIIIVEDRSASGCQPCYRKLFAGKRLAEIHIRRATDCEQIEECSRECDSEKGFSCEGFNYRIPQRHPSERVPARNNHGICELTSMPPSQIDVGRDVLHEPRYDYYERDPGCQRKKRPSRPPLYVESGWQNVRPQEDGPYLPRPSLPDLRPPVETPRPYGPDYPPKRRYPVAAEPVPQPRPWRPDYSYPQRVPGINIRPIEDDVRYERYRPGRPWTAPKERRPDYWYRPQHHDVGTNDIEPYKPGRRKDSVNGWGSVYGSVYGGSYGYGTNNIDGYDPPKRVGNPSNVQKRPYESIGGLYGDVQNYGGAFGYGDSLPPYEGENFYGYGRNRDDCSVRSGAGFKLRRGIVRKSYLAPTLDQCESLCAIEKDCLCTTFSYRYSLAANAPTDNCLLSEISYRDLDFYTDLEPDRDYDIYSMIGGERKSCEKERPASQRPPEECFWRVRSGCGVPPDVVRKTIVAEGIGDCESECVEARSFTCRSFVYRYGESRSTGINGSPNCFLSDWPSHEIDPLSLPELDGAELYQRGSFGRGCEPSPFPPLNRRGKIPPQPDNRPMKKDEVCYSEYRNPCRLTPQAVILTIYVDSEFECRERCSDMRERDPLAPCMSFSYRVSNNREEHNCFMSDVPRRDLRPGIDYVHGDGHLLFAWKEFEPLCDSGYSIGIFIDDDRDFRPNRPAPPFEENEQRPVRPHGNRYPPPPADFGDHGPGERPFGHGGGYGNSRPINDGGYRDPIRPVNPDRPDPIGPNYGGGGGGSFYDTDDRFGDGYSDDRYNDFSHKHGGSTFQRFTVNGHPCKRGTRCERNKVAGFWSCEPEGGEFGTWDYCCEPKHHCGYSQGYHYPWCYVGPYEDQWRPCSEQYYPYLPIPRPVRPSGDWYQDDSYGETPRPGMLGRHWPVAYLHREAPPNATYSYGAGDSRRNRELVNASLKTNGTSRLAARSSQVSENYVISNSDLRKELRSSSESVGRAGKVERITRFSGSRNKEIRINRNSSNGKSDGSQREIDEIIEFKDLIDGRDAKTNRTLPSVSSDWRGKTFVRLETISPNKTGDSKFEDYFEVVNVE